MIKDQLKELPKKVVDRPLSNIPGIFAVEGHLVLEEDVFHTRVEAEGNIIVNGSAERSHLSSRTGSVFLLFGSTDDTNISAKRNIYVRHSSEAGLTAGEDIIIEKSVSRSVLRAGRKIISETDDAKIVGGRAEAQEQIAVQALGSSSEVTTEVVVANPQGIIVFREIFPGVVLRIGRQSHRVTSHIREGLAAVSKGELKFCLKRDDSFDEKVEKLTGVVR